MGVLNIEETFNEMTECERDWSDRIRLKYIISSYSTKTKIRERLGFDDSSVNINKNIKGKQKYVVHDKFLKWIDKNHMFKELDNMIETVNSEYGGCLTEAIMMYDMFVELCVEADHKPKNIIL